MPRACHFCRAATSCGHRDARRSGAKSATFPHVTCELPGRHATGGVVHARRKGGAPACWSRSGWATSSSRAAGSSTPSTAPAPRCVVLLHGQLMLRRMHDPLARRIAAAGLPGHHPRPARPRAQRPPDRAERYSMTAFAAAGGRAARPPRGRRRRRRGYVARRQRHPRGRRRSRRIGCAGMILEMPVLDHAVEAGIVAFAPADLRRPGHPVGGHAWCSRRRGRPACTGAVLGRRRARHARPAARPDGGHRARHLLRPDRAVRRGCAAASQRRRS